MALLKPSFVALVLALGAVAQQGAYQQCGGIGWQGSNACISGYSCQKLNDFYSQCLPGAATSTVPNTTPTPTPTTPTQTQPTPTPTQSQPTNPGPVSCQPLPATLTFKANTKLPDPFTFYDGRKVTSKADWECRRQEIFELLQRTEFGTLPPKPSSVTGSLSGTSLTVNVSHEGKSISFSASVNIPSGSGNVPALIALAGSSLPSLSGVASINFNNDDIAAQANTGSRGNGKFYTLYGRDHSASAMTAWAWGVSRIIDVLETLPNSRIDLKKLAVTGCSRNGKGAMTIGAFEPRIALTLPQESGSGGAACWRLSDDIQKSGTSTQTASQIVTENVWFSPLFNQYTSRVNDLPTDHHLFAALIAPRALLVIEHSGIDWLGPKSTWGCMVTARKVWEALGVADNMGVSSYGGHNHCQFPSSQNGDLNAFVNKFLKDQDGNTTVVKTDNSNRFGYQESQWVDWTTPTLS
ncbi:carbohydrate esterase family 15 protein [Coprinellus micaceus]|uniref:(4-O-methyl)-D-glucuronate--lignin esterase n=1 Tax=Coprinellus micaceus TaxID=71717 RepID=A0A4Y7T2K2_COPMI|nr:carbohydrate esterase family 15 protein [Coprinellus micaceus]